MSIYAYKYVHMYICMNRSKYKQRFHCLDYTSSWPLHSRGMKQQKANTAASPSASPRKEQQRGQRLLLAVLFSIGQLAILTGQLGTQQLALRLQRLAILPNKLAVLRQLAIIFYSQLYSLISQLINQLAILQLAVLTNQLAIVQLAVLIRPLAIRINHLALLINQLAILQLAILINQIAIGEKLDIHIIQLAILFNELATGEELASQLQP